jgi:hypothetical protein
MKRRTGCPLCSITIRSLVADQFASLRDNLGQTASGDSSKFFVSVSAQHVQFALPPIASFLRSAVAKNSKLAPFCLSTRGRTREQLGNLDVLCGAQQGDGGWRPKCFPWHLRDVTLVRKQKIEHPPPQTLRLSLARGNGPRRATDCRSPGVRKQSKKPAAANRPTTGQTVLLLTG